MKELGTVKGLGGTGMPRRSADLMVCVAILPRSMRIMISWGSWLGPIFPKPFYENGRVQNRRQMKHAVGDADTSYANQQYPFILFPAEKLVPELIHQAVDNK